MTGYRSWAGTLLGVALLAAATLVPASAEEPEPSPSEAPGFVADELVDTPEVLREKELEVADLMAQFDAARDLLRMPGAEDMYFVPETRTATVLATTITPELRAAADELIAQGTSGFRVELQSTPYSRADWDALADDLLNNVSGWADGLPGRPGGGYMADKGYVLLTVMDYHDPEAWQKAAEDRAGGRVMVQIAREPESGGSAEVGSRNADSAPRTGGAALGICTAGFNWVKWGSTVRWGSTAQHCQATNFFNNGVLWGSSVGTGHFPSDSRALSRAGTNQYGPTVYVGTTATTDVRTVISAKASWSVGEVVAYGGGLSSGYSTAYVTAPNYTMPSGPSCGSNRKGVLMDRHNTTGGDSGGPWLTARSDLKIIAHGLHHGYDVCATGYSFFIPVNSVSAGLGASILLGS